jgi:hypothetical protein
MPSSANRWFVAANWLAAMLAMASAAVHGEFGVASVWVLTAALFVTVGCLGWPQATATRGLGIIGLAWQLALIGAYWPFAGRQAATDLWGQLGWNLPVLVILSVLALLGLSFLVLFVLPAIGLRRRLGRARSHLTAHQQHGLDLVVQELDSDPALRHLWLQYRSQVRIPADGAPAQQVHALASARDVFDLHTLTHSRLRLDLFRHVPGIITGLGIIGTFAGIIKGIRGLRYSQDPAEMQRVFDVLAGGVAEAFFVSMTAITLAMAVALVEKTLMSSIAHALDGLNVGLDAVFPPRPSAESPPVAPQAPAQAQTQAPMPSPPAMAHPAQAAGAAVEAAPPAGVAAMRPLGESAPGHLATATAPLAAQPPAPAPPEPSTARIDWPTQLLEVTAQTQAATHAMAELARALPKLLAEQGEAAGQAQQQTMQSLRTLSSRLEGVASSIEVSGRRTLEAVAARLMQAELQMVSRNQAVAEHLGELVQRIETLCGLMQQDRSALNVHTGPDPFAALMAGAGPDPGQRPGLNQTPNVTLFNAAQATSAAGPGLAASADSNFGSPPDWADLWVPEPPGPRGFGA